jgi:hypothetical protein
LSLDDEIAHLRDLDLHGLRARWKGLFRQQPPQHLPRGANSAYPACQRPDSEKYATNRPR